MSDSTALVLFDMPSGRTCRQCGSEVSADRLGNARFCDDRCCKDWHSDRIVQRRARRITGTVYEIACRQCGELIRFDRAAVFRAPDFCKESCRVRKKRDRELMRMYGITLEEYEARWSEQDGRCWICTCDLVIGKHNKRYAVVDHCHSTGAVRGLLCQFCNVGLGAFGDDVERMQRAIEYLKEN